MSELDWDIMAPMPPEPDTDSKQYEQISSEPKTLYSGNRQTFAGPLVMRTKNKDKYYNLFDSYVEVDFKITLRDGTDAFDPGDPDDPVTTKLCTLINGGWHLFDRATLSINNEIVEDVQLPGKCHLWHALTKYTPSEAEEVADSEFIYLDGYTQRQGGGGPNPTDYSKVHKAIGWAAPYDYTATAQTDVSSANPIPIASKIVYGTPDSQMKFNSGYARRLARTKSGRVCRLHLPLRAIFGLAEHQKPIRGVAIQVTLYKSNDYDHILHSPYEVDALVPQLLHATVLQTCSLWLPSVMPSKETEIEVESQLVEGAATKYQFISRTCYRSEVFESATTRLEWDVGALTAKPLLAIIGFMSEGQFSIQYDSYGVTESPALSVAFAVPSAVNVATAVKPEVAPFLIEEDSPAANIGGRIQNHCNNGGMTSHLNNIRRLAVRINDMPYPAEPYRMSFDDETTMRAYQDYLEVWGKGGESAKCLPYAVWKEMPLFCIRFHSPDAFYTDRANIMRVETEVNSSARQLSNGVDAPVFEIPHRGLYGKPISGPGAFQMYCVVYYEREIDVSADNGYMRYAT